jgi:hypothetical protein
LELKNGYGSIPVHHCLEHFAAVIGNNRDEVKAIGQRTHIDAFAEFIYLIPAHEQLPFIVAYFDLPYVVFLPRL